MTDVFRGLPAPGMGENDPRIWERRERIARILAPWENPERAPEADTRGMPAEEIDSHWMSAALALAREAAEEGEVPVGCVIVREGRILAAEYNGRERMKNALWHAEAAAVSEACRALGGWRLPGSALYVTLEPCPMCAGAIWNARIPRVVIGAKDPRAGAMGSLLNLAAYPLNHRPAATFGVREEECRRILWDFFRERRK